MTGPRREPSRRHRSNRALHLVVALLPVIACFLGGATEKWSEGVILIAFGSLLLFDAPHRGAGWILPSLMLALFGCAAVAFLPARWFYAPDWRVALLNDYSLVLPSTLSPQPWVTLQCLLSFVAGLTWLHYVCTRDAEPRDVRFQLRCFAAGVTLLAALSIVLFVSKHPLPFWHNERSFGPFPNRNQTADVLALTCVIVVAATYEDIVNRRKRWLLWIPALGVLIAAIVLNYSRAGILLLVVGVALWLGLLTLQRGSTARIVVGASVLLALLTCVLLFGGQTLERFQLREGGTVTRDFRWLIFRDALDLVRHSSWAGVSLGNFEPIFAVFRNASSNDTRAHHPESDWIWWWSEAGWIALAIAIVGTVVLFVRAFPRAESRNHRFRLAAFVAAVLFALHGCFDVSAHRVGSAFAAIFLLGAAMRRPNESQPNTLTPVCSRLLAVGLIVCGGIWIATTRGLLQVPGSLAAESLRNSATLANRGGDFRDAIALSSRALGWTPLDWQLYFLRAVAFANERQPQPALDDFRRARYLEPNAFEVPLEEGRVWATIQPSLAVIAWREALRRAGSDRREAFLRIVRIAEQFNPRLLGPLEQLSHTHGELVVAFVERLNGDQFQNAIDRLLDDDPDLRAINQRERASFFALWAARGDAERLAQFVQEHPDALESAWRGIAKSRAQAGDFRAAVELAFRFTPRPPLPQVATTQSADKLQRSLATDPQNYATGYALFARQKSEGRSADALSTLRHFTAQQDSPAYFHFLEAEAWAALQNWERAWEAWQHYAAATAKTR